MYNDSAAIGNLTWIPVVFDSFLLTGTDSMMSGAKERFSLFKRYTDTNSIYTMSVPQPIESIDNVTLTARNQMTVNLAQMELFGVNGINLKFPLSVQWSDVVGMSVLIVEDGSEYRPSLSLDVTPTSLGGLLDSNRCGFSLYNDSRYSSEALSQVDATAVGGSCLRMKCSDYYTYDPPTLAVKVLDAGTLSFNYRLQDPVYGAKLWVRVDGGTVTGYPDTDIAGWAAAYGDAWTNDSVEVTGAGPHVVEFLFRGGDYQPARTLCDIDNVQWTPGGGASSSITGGEVTGPSDAGGQDVLDYYFDLKGTITDGGGSSSSETWPVTPDEWELQYVSGDPDALSVNYISEYFEVRVSETVTNDSVFRVVGRYSIGGSTYSGTRNVTVPARVPVADAIFDSGTYDNCLPGWPNGWYGTFSDYTAGDSCAKCETPAEGERASFTVRLCGKGTLAFDWKVSCASGDALEFHKTAYGEGPATVSITGTGAGWRHVEIEYGDDEDVDAYGRPIERECEWRFVKGSGTSAGSNCGWVDNVTWSGTTPTPISYAEVNVPSTLAPGDTVPLSLMFYRYDKDWNLIEATDPDLPEIESITLIDYMDGALTNFLSAVQDGSGNWSLTVAADCNVSGYLEIEAWYTLYGDSTYSSAYPSVDATSAHSLLGLSRGAGGRSPMSMSANGINTLAECELAGLDPEDPDAKLTVSVTVLNGVPHITWSPNLPDRTYIIKGKASLATPQWVDVGKVPQGDTEWVAPANSTYRFFKVEIESNK